MAITRQAHRSRKGAGKGIRGAFGRIFCKRSIIIIAEHKTQHVPISARFQIAGLLVTTAIVGWCSYSSGSYMATQQMLEEKDRKIANSTRENMRVSAEFTLLKSDLMRLASAGKGNKTAEDAKKIAEHYAQAGVADTAASTSSGDDNSAEYAEVFKRVEFLDNKVKELQATHDEMIADIRSMTGGKIHEFERVIAKTGVGTQALEKAADASHSQSEQHQEKYGRIEGIATKGAAAKPVEAKEDADAGGQGGPFIPVKTLRLQEQDPELYYNMRRMMVLNDIVSAMPLAAPLRDGSYKQTSGFGVRVDPFRGAMAFHSGVDLAGPEHAKVLATQDGKVEFSGWQSAYGNMVDIKHKYGLSTRYAHLERVLVQPEQWVHKGQIIGIQGSTGRSTGHHLHYEVRYQGKAINPSNFLKVGNDVQASNE